MFFLDQFFGHTKKNKYKPIKPQIIRKVPDLFEVVNDFEDIGFADEEHRNVRKFKRNSDDSSQPELFYFKRADEKEVVLANYYRLLLGPDRAPKTTPVYKIVEGQYQYVGLLSKEIDGFRSTSSFYKENKKRYEEEKGIQYQEWAEMDCAGVLAISMVLGESDLNGINWGKNCNNQFVRIDFGHSGNYVFHNITSNDLLNLPIVRDYHPSQWPYKCYHQSDTTWDPYELAGINELEHFRNQEWKYLLKSILIDQQLLKNINQAYAISEDCSKPLVKRLVELKKTLFKIPEFKEFIKENSQVIDEIAAEFEAYNDSVDADNGPQNTKVDIAAIRERHETIFNACRDNQTLEEEKDPLTSKKEFKLFKKAYFKQYNSEFFKNPWSTMKLALESGEKYTTMEQVRQYAQEHQSSRTYKVLHSSMQI
ncbi:hypothetical protein [Legionella sp.]|uniref:hypothetical protein n=1 Tax=Legionella sp. TaxID=459 RepID=UPI000CB17659|nr:hypothetical protein [Legionella sp.]PJE08277.1 MAG: hypothetical protein CK430_12715 [Legionella sp.]